jgi:hypothetical protein
LQLDRSCVSPKGGRSVRGKQFRTGDVETCTGTLNGVKQVEIPRTNLVPQIVPVSELGATMLLRSVAVLTAAVVAEAFAPTCVPQLRRLFVCHNCVVCSFARPTACLTLCYHSSSPVQTPTHSLLWQQHGSPEFESHRCNAAFRQKDRPERRVWWRFRQHQGGDREAQQR